MESERNMRGLSALLKIFTNVSSNVNTFTFFLPIYLRMALTQGVFVVVCLFFEVFP